MIIKKTKTHNINMIILAILSVICFLVPLYFLGGPKDKIFVYSFIFLPFGLYFAFLFLLMRLSLNDQIEITPNGLLISRHFKQPIPWAELQSATIEDLDMYGSATLPLLIIVFRTTHIEKKLFGLDYKPYQAGEEISFGA